MPGCPRCNTAACEHDLAPGLEPPSLIKFPHHHHLCTALINTFGGYMPVGGVKGMGGADGGSRLSEDWAEVGCTRVSGIWLHDACIVVHVIVHAMHLIQANPRAILAISISRPLHQISSSVLGRFSRYCLRRRTAIFGVLIAAQYTPGPLLIVAACGIYRQRGGRIVAILSLIDTSTAAKSASKTSAALHSDRRRANDLIWSHALAPCYCCSWWRPLRLQNRLTAPVTP